MISNKPDSSEFEGNVDLTFSNTNNGENNYTTSAMLNVPLVKDKAAIRLVALYDEMGGFIDWTDINTNAVIKEDANGSKTVGARIALRLTPSDRFIIDTTLLFSKTESDRMNFATEALTKASATQEFFDDELLGLNLTVQYDFGFADLISSTSYFDRNLTGVEDQSMLNGTVEGFKWLYVLFNAKCYWVARTRP